MSNKVEYNGKIYETGKYYLSGRSVYQLNHISNSARFPFRVDSIDGYNHCHEINTIGDSPDIFGTITEAPFKSEIGKLYEFSDTGNLWWLHPLRGVDYENTTHPYITNECNFKQCRPVPKSEQSEYGK
jgi:hypothetical protein